MNITIDDTIKDFERNIRTYENCFSKDFLSTLRGYNRDIQIIEWLKELKVYKGEE